MIQVMYLTLIESEMNSFRLLDLGIAYIIERIDGKWSRDFYIRLGGSQK